MRVNFNEVLVRNYLSLFIGSECKISNTVDSITFDRNLFKVSLGTTVVKIRNLTVCIEC